MYSQEIIPPLNKGQGLVIRLHVDSIHTTFGLPNLSPHGIELNSQLNNGDFREEYYYINNTFRDITVMSRNGLAVTVTKTPSTSNSTFIIRKVIRLRGLSLESAISSIASIADIDDAELLEIKRAFNNIKLGGWVSASVMFDYVIKSEDLRLTGGTIYHYQTDLIVSIFDSIKVNVHPYSTRFLGIGTFGLTTEYAMQSELNLKIRYVSHDRKAAPKYMNIAGSILKIFPQWDAAPKYVAVKDENGKYPVIERIDYIQVFYSARNECIPIAGNGVAILKMPYEEAKIKLGIYDTYADALNSGNVEANRKRELLELMHKVELVKQNNILDRSDIETLELERKQKLAEKELELETMKKEIATLDTELKLQLKKLDLDSAHQKQIQTDLDNKLQEVQNEKTALALLKKEQEDKLEKERLEFMQRLNFQREENENKFKTEQMFWKDHYEKRSQERKDASEFVKFVPGLIIGVAGIVAAWIKFSTPTKAV
jgi:hypothetical protein